MAYSTLHLNKDAATGVATVMLDRPPRNALEHAMANDLDAVLTDLAGDEGVRAVVLTGAGPAFCAGGDLKVLAAELADPEAARAFMRACHRSILAIAEMEKPVIAAVNGDAAGAGWSIALACDLIVAAKSARFIMAFVKVGLVPDLGGAWQLTQLVGQHKAREWTMLGDVVTADEAARFGVVNRVVETPEAALPAARALAAQLAAGPALSLALMKGMVARYGTLSLADALEDEAEAQAIAAQSEDFQEGVRAFQQKRPPTFKGK
jgi:2-(1,2-epoxy-1,2-dihydrophenyl)acetyl-CoA isomerase